MPRMLRIEYEDACHHVCARGNARGPIVGNDHDRDWFVETLAEAVARSNSLHIMILAWREKRLAATRQARVGMRPFSQLPRCSSVSEPAPLPPCALNLGKNSAFHNTHSVGWTTLDCADDHCGRLAYRHRVERLVVEKRNSSEPWKADLEWQRIRKGWVFGSEKFKARMLDKVGQSSKAEIRDSENT